MSGWTKEMLARATARAELANNTSAVCTGGALDRAEWFAEFAFDALAEIERLQGENRRMAVEIIRRGNIIGLVRSVLDQHFQSGSEDRWKTNPDCGCSGPCPCSEAHAGSDGACRADPT